MRNAKFIQKVITIRHIILLMFIGALIQGYMIFVHRENGIQEPDTAVYGLMAKHIYEGVDFPLIIDGQPYSSALHSYVSAALFLLFGISATSIRLVSLIFILVLILVSYRLASDMFGKKVGLVSGLWISIAPLPFHFYSFPLSFYTLTLVLGTYSLLLTFRLCYWPISVQQGRKYLMLFGVTASVGLWVQPLILPYLLSAIFFLLLRARRHLSRLNLLLCFANFLIGASPLIIYNLTHHGQNLIFIQSIFHGSGQAFWDLPSRAYNYLVILLPILLGGRPLWSVDRLELSWGLPPNLNQFLLLTAFLVTLVMVSVGGWFWAWRRNAVKPFSSRAKSLLAMLSLIIIIIIGSVSVYFRQLLIEMSEAIRTGNITWSLFPGGQEYSLSSLKAEVLSADMLIYLLYLPAVGYILYKRRQNQIHQGIDLLLFFAVMMTGAYLFSGYGGARTPRYLLPLYSVIPIVFATFLCDLERYAKSLSRIIIVTFLIVHISGFLAMPTSLFFQPSNYLRWYYIEDPRLIPVSNKPIIEFLRTQRIFHVYTKYSLGMPLIFDSKEQILTSFGEPCRYPQYDKSVARSERVAYLFHANSPENIRFQIILARGNIPYKKVHIAYSDVYYEVELGNRFVSPFWPDILSCLKAL
jgi:4-amino-4-deoxy-L-arabinose transferase-like glycosyltransferase